MGDQEFDTEDIDHEAQEVPGEPVPLTAQEMYAVDLDPDPEEVEG